jgi:hypothetical protein
VCTASIIKAIIALIMEAVRTSETSVHSNETTRRCIPEASNLHIRRREKRKYIIYVENILVEMDRSTYKADCDHHTTKIVVLSIASQKQNFHFETFP